MTCNDTQIQANAHASAAANPNRLYAPVIILETKTQGNEITFYATNDSQQKLHTAVWGDQKAMWAACPSTITNSPDVANLAAPPTAKTTGLLYLSDAYVSQEQIAASPKWPLSLAGSNPTQPLKLFPLELKLTAVELQSGNFVPQTINLLDPKQAAAVQTINLTGAGTVEIQLTESSFGKFGLSYPDDVAISNAVTVVKGKNSTPKELAHAWTVIAAVAHPGGLDSIKSDETRAAIQSLLNPA